MPAASTYDEFSQLREVIVGSAKGARIPRTDDASMWLTLYGEITAEELAQVTPGPFSDQVIEETEEDLAALVDTLEGLGVVVHRVEEVDHAREFGSPDWRTDGFYSYCPRDLTLIVGSAIIEAPSPMRARYFESFGLKPILQRYMEGGSPWIAAPRPRLLEDLYGVDEDGLPVLRETEPAFEAANVLRCGRDLFYLVSCTGNELGRVWLENLLRALGGDVRVHALRGIYRFMHVDSTIALIRPGLVLLNPARVGEEDDPRTAPRMGRHLVPADGRRRSAHGFPRLGLDRHEPADGVPRPRDRRRLAAGPDPGARVALRRGDPAAPASRAASGRRVPLRHPRHRARWWSRELPRVRTR